MRNLRLFFRPQQKAPPMPLRISPEMAEVTRLTRLGKLVEATALIQRMLGGGRATTAEAGSPITIDAEYTAVESGPQGEMAGPRSRTPHPSRPHASLKETVERVAALTKSFREELHPAPAAPEGASFTTATYTNAAGARQYRLYVPANRSDERLALIIMLHGCAQTPDDFAAGTRMNALAEEHGFLVAYPRQNARANMRQCWNWFRPEDQRRGEGEPSILAGITEEIVRQHGVDRRRVYIAGLSAGGAAAAIMGDVYPDLYAGVGVHSGLPSAAAQRPRVRIRCHAAGRQGKRAVSEAYSDDHISRRKGFHRPSFQRRGCGGQGAGRSARIEADNRTRPDWPGACLCPHQLRR